MLLFLYLALFPLASCWGSLGHRTVAYLAQKHFTPAAELWVTKLLNGEDLADAAIWPDKVRTEKGWEFTRKWHFIDAEDEPPKWCLLNFTAECLGGDCIIGALSNHTKRVINASLKPVDHAESIKFIIHFFGDLHQPLHTEGLSKGGNGISVKFDGESANLHRIWDDNIPDKHVGLGKDRDREKEILAAKAWAQKLYRQDSLAECLVDIQTCALAWATEANQWACSYVFKDYYKDDWKNKAPELGKDYYQGATPIVDLQIQRAGRRLATWVNALAQTPSLVQNELR